MSSPRRSARGSSQAATPNSPSAQTPELFSDSQSLPPNGSPARSNGSPLRLPALNGAIATTSSPLFFSSSAPTAEDDGDRTPRANSNGLSTPNGMGMTPGPGDSSPLRYQSTSSPGRNGATPRQPSHPGSSGSGLFVNTPRASAGARIRRTDISSPFIHRRQVYVDDNGQPIHNDPATGVTYSNLNPNTSEADAIAGPGHMVMWGTNVTEVEIMSVVEDFLRNFTRKYRMLAEEEITQNEHFEPNDPANEKVYWEMLKMMYRIGTINLNLDLKDLKAYPPTVKLWHQIQDFPSEILPMFDQVIVQLMTAFATEKAEEVRAQQADARRNRGSSIPLPPSSGADMDDAETPRPDVDGRKPDQIIRDAETTLYTVRPFNLGTTINLRDLNPADIDRVIAVKGLVIRTTPVIPDMQSAFFQCSVCKTTIMVQIERGKIQEPTRCAREACNAPNSMQIVHNRCGFADKQIIKLQETPDNVPDGQTPHSVSLCAYRELVDFCKAGDRVEITGIFKCNNVRVNPRQRTVRSVFKTFVDVLHIQKVDKKRMGIDVSTIEQELSEQVTANVQEVRKMSEEEERRIKDTAARPDVYELLSRSLAPSIFEMDDVKKGILLQLFGGTNKSFEKGGNPKYRGDINVLLCGDPSTSKSQLLKYVHRIAPRGVYTSGKGSSAVGLTAYVTRDPETRQLVLESGALVLSDGGVCCIDEFDKMNDSTRSVLHEVMEQQTVSIAKAGIITTLNARTSILASANPIGSKYNPNLPVPQNIDLPPTLLSRFDLVYLVLDRIDESMDRKLAKHIVNMYLDDRPSNASANEVLPVEFLTSYISYARANCQPKITEAASTELVEAYVSMRKLGEDVRAAERRITATTRQLESMIRLAEAHAKMRLSETVTSDDVREAVRLIKSALKQAATDARTGLIDMSLLTEGTSSSERRRRQDLKNAVLEIVDDMSRAQGGNVRYVELGRRLAEQSSIEVTADELAESVRALQQEGALSIQGEGNRRSIRRIVGA